MKKKPNQEFYVSPQMEMIETQVQTLLCQSTTGNLDSWTYNDNDL